MCAPIPDLRLLAPCTVRYTKKLIDVGSISVQFLNCHPVHGSNLGRASSRELSSGPGKQSMANIGLVGQSAEESVQMNRAMSSVMTEYSEQMTTR